MIDSGTSVKHSLATSILSNRLIMYGLIGGGASAVDVGLFVLLHEFYEWGAIASHSVSIPVSAGFSFILNAYLNFKTTDKLFQRLISFLIVVGLGYLLGVAIIALVEIAMIGGGTIGKLISLPFVFFFQYFLNSKISFKSSVNA